MKDQDFDFVRELVRERSAIVLEDGKQYLVESRLAPIVRELKLNTIEELVDRLREPYASDLHQRVVEAMVTTETTFFRDHAPLRDDTKGRAPGAHAEASERAPAERLVRGLLYRTGALQPGDLDTRTLPRAGGMEREYPGDRHLAGSPGPRREGRYSQIEVNRGLPAALLVKHFRQHGTSWQLRDEVRSMVDFQEFNLVRAWPPLPRMDLVFLRNVMIYFDVETKKAILDRMARVMQTDGYILLGGAETTFNINESYQRIEQLKSGFYQLIG